MNEMQEVLEALMATEASPERDAALDHLIEVMERERAK